MKRLIWKSWAFVAVAAILVLVIGWIWFGRNGLLWAVPIVLGINYFLLIHSRFRVLDIAAKRRLAGHDAWKANLALSELCAKAGVHTPRLKVIESPTPQAYLLGRFSALSTLYVTQGFLDRLDESERRAVMALAVATLQSGLQFNFLIVGAFFNLVFAVIGTLDRLISWVFGTKRRWVRSVASFLAWPFLMVIQRWCLSPKDYFRLDSMAADLCADPDALCQALWKLESTSLTQPLNVHPAWSHVFAVSPQDRHAPFGYLQPQPSAKRRILRLSHGEYPV